MAIEVTRAHDLDPETVRRRVEDLAARLADTLKATYAWRGDRLVFGRKGVEGYVDVAERAVTVYVSKSRALPIPESWIRQQIEAHLDRHLG